MNSGKNISLILLLQFFEANFFDKTCFPETARSIFCYNRQDLISRNFIIDFFSQLVIFICDFSCFRLKASLSPGTPHTSASSSGATPVDVASTRTTLDPALLLDIENDARYLATSVDNLVENLSGTLQSISALTVETVDTYKVRHRLHSIDIVSIVRNSVNLIFSLLFPAFCFPIFVTRLAAT